MQTSRNDSEENNTPTKETLVTPKSPSVESKQDKDMNLPKSEETVTKEPEHSKFEGYKVHESKKDSKKEVSDEHIALRYKTSTANVKVPLIQSTSQRLKAKINFPSSTEKYLTRPNQGSLTKRTSEKPVMDSNRLETPEYSKPFGVRSFLVEGKPYRSLKVEKPAKPDPSVQPEVGSYNSLPGRGRYDKKGSPKEKRVTFQESDAPQEKKGPKLFRNAGNTVVIEGEDTYTIRRVSDINKPLERTKAIDQEDAKTAKVESCGKLVDDKSAEHLKIIEKPEPNVNQARDTQTRNKVKYPEISDEPHTDIDPRKYYSTKYKGAGRDFSGLGSITSPKLSKYLPDTNQTEEKESAAVAVKTEPDHARSDSYTRAINVREDIPTNTNTQEIKDVRSNLKPESYKVVTSRSSHPDRSVHREIQQRPSFDQTAANPSARSRSLEDEKQDSLLKRTDTSHKTELDDETAYTGIIDKVTSIQQKKQNIDDLNESRFDQKDRGFLMTNTIPLQKQNITETEGAVSKGASYKFKARDPTETESHTTTNAVDRQRHMHDLEVRSKHPTSGRQPDDGEFRQTRFDSAASHSNSDVDLASLRHNLVRASFTDLDKKEDSEKERTQNITEGLTKHNRKDISFKANSADISDESKRQHSEKHFVRQQGPPKPKRMFSASESETDVERPVDKRAHSSKVNNETQSSKHKPDVTNSSNLHKNRNVTDNTIERVSDAKKGQAETSTTSVGENIKEADSRKRESVGKLPVSHGKSKLDQLHEEHVRLSDNRVGKARDVPKIMVKPYSDSRSQYHNTSGQPTVYNREAKEIKDKREGGHGEQVQSRLFVISCKQMPPTCILEYIQKRLA